VTEYSQDVPIDDWRTGLTRLSLDIIAGNIPDIFNISGLPVEQYVAMGLLEDLYPFIDNDPELSREDFIEYILRSAEIDGGLYYVFPIFTLPTIIGNPIVLGSKTDWNLDEFLAVLDENPEADVPLGARWTNEIFFTHAILRNINYFFNRDTGEVDFDNEDFIKLLEVANRFPSVAPEFGEYDERDDIATGRQIMAYSSNYDFSQYQMYREFFGGELVFKGSPTVDRRGNMIWAFPSFAISSVSENKDGAWSFIRSLMTESSLRNTITESPHGIPSNKAVLDWMIENAMNEPEGTVSIGADFGGGFSIIEVAASPLSEAEKNLFLERIYAAMPERGDDSELFSLTDIILETASDYFAGRITAEDAARIIQSRASIFAAEQFG